MITVQLPKGSVSRSGDYNTQESNVGEEKPPNPLRTRGGSGRPAEERLARRWLCGLSPRGAWGTAEEKAHSQLAAIWGRSESEGGTPKERRPAAWRRHGPPAESRRGVRSGAHSAQSDTWRRRGGAGDEATRKTGSRRLALAWAGAGRGDAAGGPRSALTCLSEEGVRKAWCGVGRHRSEAGLG